MLFPAAEKVFDKGRTSLLGGRATEALAYFEAAIEMDRKFGKSRPEARYLSYYGLCLGLQRNQLHEALRFCREAASIEGYNPDIRCNLGLILMRAGRRREAHIALIRGLSLEPRHKGLRKALRKMGLRKRPVIPFLARGNPLNVLLGKARTRTG